MKYNHSLRIDIYEERLAYLSKKSIEMEVSMLHELPSTIGFWSSYIKNHNKYSIGNKGYFKSNDEGEVIEVGIKSFDGWWRILTKQYGPQNIVI
jgi:hypothetical protein